MGSGVAFFGSFEGFGNQLAIGFLEKYFDATFGFFELLLTFAREADAFFKKLHGVVEGELRAFEFADYFFEASEGAFEIGFFCGNCFRLFGSELIQLGSSKSASIILSKTQLPCSVSLFFVIDTRVRRAKVFYGRVKNRNKTTFDRDREI
jgi:hypothetical protein